MHPLPICLQPYCSYIHVMAVLRTSIAISSTSRYKTAPHTLSLAGTRAWLSTSKIETAMLLRCDGHQEEYYKSQSRSEIYATQTSEAMPQCRNAAPAEPLLFTLSTLRREVVARSVKGHNPFSISRNRSLPHCRLFQARKMLTQEHPVVIAMPIISCLPSRCQQTPSPSCRTYGTILHDEQPPHQDSMTLLNTELLTILSVPHGCHAELHTPCVTTIHNRRRSQITLYQRVGCDGGCVSNGAPRLCSTTTRLKVT